MPAPNALEIEQHNILQFRDDFLHAYQQWGSVLLPHVSEIDGAGEATVIANTYGAATTRQSDERFRTNPWSITPRTRRWLPICPTIEWGEPIETEDDLRQMRNPQSDLMQAGAAAVGRGVDEIIISGLRAPAMEGKYLAGAASVPFPTANRIAAAVGTTDGTTPTGLNPEKLRVARDKLGSNKIDLSRVQPKLLLDTRDHTALSRYVELTSADFYRVDGERPYYVDGRLRRVMGFDLVEYNGLPESGGTRVNIVFVKEDVAAVRWKGVSPDSWMLTERRKIPYVYASAIYNCGRKRDGGVLEILNAAA